MTTKIKILAPVGSYESLATAVQAGADAIYFGVEQLNMRVKSAGAFSIDDIATVAEKCDEHNIRKYLTLNTTVYDYDKNLFTEIIAASKAAGVDAIIASDFAVIMECRTQGMPVHVSTQANVSNLDSVKFFSTFADLVVLSRELTLKQVEAITHGIERHDVRGPSGELVKIEIFGHGALCMAISGKCYLSLHSNNSSANRGACIQNCRHKYTVIDQDTRQELEIDNEYIMSAKDLCTIDILDKIAETGISVLKIEGRGRTADYVFETVRVYKEALAALEEGTYTPEKIKQWQHDLSTVFNRGFWEGYYLGRKLGEWNETDGSKATQKKVYIAQGVRYFPKIKVAEFKLESGKLKVGDEVLVIGPVTGIVRQVVEAIHVDNGPVDIVKQGCNFTIPFSAHIRPSDKLYKLIPTEYADADPLP
jgi:U32 family peptidase